ncbi:MAG: MarR family transcriptional regulator [Bryobacteraceae bacterium]|nr:MarR family transcriptional regulator [Bryobacteraceae bacterium]
MPPDSNPTISQTRGLSFLIGRVYYNYTSLLTQRLVEYGLAEHLIPGMGPVLFALFDDDGLLMKEAAQRAGIAPSTLSGLVRRMEANGVIRRVPDSVDGRAARLWLTPLGRSLEPACRRLAEQMETELRAGLSDGEKRELEELLQRLLRKIQARLPGSGVELAMEARP